MTAFLIAHIRIAILLIFVCSSMGFAQDSALDKWYRTISLLEANGPEKNLLASMVEQAKVTKDADIINLSLAISAPGLRLLNENNLAKESFEELSTKADSKPYLQMFSPENLMSPCDTCNATGFQVSPCQTCGRTGVCSDCRGAGAKNIPSVNGRRIVPCLSCNRSGKCKNCSGKGVVRIRCRECGGSGKLADANKLKAIYEQLLSKSDRYNPHQVELVDSRTQGFDSSPSSPESIHPITSVPGSVSPAAVEMAKTLNQELQVITGDLIEVLEEKGIEKLAVSRVYYNGSGVDPVAKYVQRSVIGEILNQAPVSLQVMERNDLQVLVSENKLQFAIKGAEASSIAESEALLMGEFLYSKSYTDAVLSIRVIDSGTSKILFASISKVRLDSSLGQRLGVQEDSTKYAPIPEPDLALGKESRFIERIKDHQPFSLTPVSAVPKPYLFNTRVLYCYMVSELVNAEIEVLEREFLYQIADERTLVEKGLESLKWGGGVIRTEVDEASPPGAPTFFIRAIKRDGGTLLGQARIKLQATQRQFAGNPARTEMREIGSQDSIDAAVREYQNKAKVGNAEALQFQEAFVFAKELQVDRDTLLLLKKYGRNWRYNTSYISSNNLLVLDWRTSFLFDDNGYPPINGEEFFDRMYEKLIPGEEGNIEAIRAGLLMQTLGMRKALISNHDGGLTRKDTELFLGPLSIIHLKVFSQYTLNIDRSPSPEIWQECFLSFHRAVYRSMHPNKLDQNAIDPHKGTFKYTDEWNRNNTIIFNYIIETKWNGRYPSTVKVMIDFSPMKDRIYKVKQPESSGQGLRPFGF